MKLQILLASILRGVWSMEPTAAQSYYPLLHNLMSGNINNINPVATEYVPKLISGSSMGVGTSNDSEEQVVQVISLKDVVHKYDQECGPRGTETMVRRLKAAGRDSQVAAIIIDLDTPGGEGGACQLPVQVIEEVRSTKPVIAYVGNGICASAGYYIASAADEIYATFETDEIGSIGTYVTLADFKSYYESQGLKLHEIYATESTNKNKPYKDALEGKYDSIRKQLIDPFNQQFLNTVMENRGIKAGSEPLTGKLYFAKEAQEVGLIDGIMSWDKVVLRAFELAQNPDLNKRPGRMKSSTASPTPTLVDKLSAKVTDIVTALTSNHNSNIEMDLGQVKQKLEAAGEGQPVAITAEESAAIVAYIDATDAGEELFTQADVTAQVNTAVEAAERVKDEEIQTLTTANANLTSENKSLKKDPAATVVIPAAASTTVTGEEKKDEFSTSVDAEIAEYKSAKK